MRLYFLVPVGLHKCIHAAFESDSNFEFDRVIEEPGGVFGCLFEGVGCEEAEGAVVRGANLHRRVFTGVGFELEGEAGGAGCGGG